MLGSIFNGVKKRKQFKKSDFIGWNLHVFGQNIPLGAVCGAKKIIIDGSENFTDWSQEAQTNSGQDGRLIASIQQKAGPNSSLLSAESAWEVESLGL